MPSLISQQQQQHRYPAPSHSHSHIRSSAVPARPVSSSLPYASVSASSVASGRPQPPSATSAPVSVSGPAASTGADSFLPLRCNLCWSALSGSALLTRCSHLFCSIHARDWFHQNPKCPSCDKRLVGDEVRKISLTSAEYKNQTALWGLQPAESKINRPNNGQPLTNQHLSHSRAVHHYFLFFQFFV